MFMRMKHAFSETQQDYGVADRKSEESPMFMRVVAGVADRSGEMGAMDTKGEGKTLPRCPVCGSFYLYPEKDGRTSCQTCNT